MMKPLFLRPLLTMLVLTMLLLAAPAAAQDQWDREKGNCDAVFETSTTVVLNQLKQCAGRWLAYADPNLLKPNKRQAMKDALQDLYDRAIKRRDEEAEYLATAGAERMGTTIRLKVKRANPTPARTGGKTRNPRGERGDPDEPVTASRRQKFVAPVVSEGNQRKAGKLVKAGVKLFKRGKRSAATRKYRKALELDPGNLDAIYNLAAELAFAKRGEESVDELRKLQDIGTKPALKRLQQSRIDPDFEKIRDYIPYKRVSGYARIKVVNSIGEFGEDEVDRIVKTLDKLKHKDVDTGADKVNGRKSPVIWFRDHSAPTAYLVKKVVLHPGVVLTKITWNSDYDIIVSWGNKIVKKDGVEQPAKDYTELDPAKQEQRMDDLLREEDKVLREPERTARKVEHTIDTPKRVESKVDSGVNRVEKTVDTLQKTGDKIKGVFK
jgi:tetratricopeptide (TPR) repeat protein